jgi:type IV secretion system protein VirB9
MSMQRALLLLIIAAFAHVPALAFMQERDARVVERNYSPETVYPVAGIIGIQTAVMFADEERIENIAIGDGSNWQVTPNKRANILFIKPIATKKVTNLTVVTNRRAYLFELNSTDQKAAPIFTMRFKYPPDPIESSPPDLTKIPPEALSEEGAVAAPKINFNWAKSGKSKLWPSEIFDDGTLTYLRWPKGVSPPAIYSVGAEGTEALVNQMVQNDYFVIDFVPSALMLRLGKAKARLDRQVDAESPVTKTGIGQ